MEREIVLSEHALDMLEIADMALASAQGLAITDVHTDAQITKDWLETVLGGGEDARLLAADCTEGHDGMTVRRRWSLQWNEGGKLSGLPENVFIKVTPDEPYLRETLALLHMAEHEVRFYNTMQKNVSSISPKPYFGAFYPGGRFILLTENLESEGKTPYWLHHHCSIEHAKAVCTALAELHATFWESDRFETDLGWVRPRTQRFGRKWHIRSFETARAAYPDTEFGKNMPDEIRAILDLWSEGYEEVYKYWESLPTTVLHGDSHLGNTYANPDGSAGFFDWQVILRGNGLRDVSYFIGSALSNQDRATNERLIVDHYLTELRNRGIDLNPDAAWADYCLFGLDRFDAHMKTCVFGGYGHSEDGRMRGRDTIFGSFIDNNVLGLLQTVLKNGSV